LNDLFELSLTRLIGFLEPKSLHLDPHFGAHVLEHDAYRVDDFLVVVRFAILDHLMLRFASLLEIEEMLVGEAVVPAAVPPARRCCDGVLGCGG
jgi:hypothetical protein